MPLKYIFLSFFLFVFSSVIAQQKILKGYLGIAHGESFTYKIEFSDSLGYIKGYAYTWLDENKDVKAAIQGFIDKKNRTLYFHETGIIYNHGFESNTTICLINAELKYKDENGSKIFSGPISSSDASNVYCGQGTVRFMDSETLKSLFDGAEKVAPIKNDILSKPISKKIVKIIYDTVSKPFISHNFQEKNKEETITSGIEKEYDWSSDSLIIDVWDGGQVDGDIITILFNNEIILNKYSLTQEKKRINIALQDKSLNQLVIIAVNEGNEPPNTANLLLIDGAKQYPVIAYNAIGKRATIKIKKIGKN